MTAPVQHPLPMLDIDVLRTFVAIADTGSFSSAANAVFRTPSAVSMQIKKLEEQLGVAVFDRDARSVTLTGDGEILLGYARRLLALNREAVSKFVAPTVTGIVRLGSPDDIGECVLPLVLKRFAETHPGVTVDVVIDQSSNLRKRLDERRLDVTLVNISQAVPTRMMWKSCLMKSSSGQGQNAARPIAAILCRFRSGKRGVHGALMRYRRWKRAGGLTASPI